MMNEQKQRIEELFQAALELDTPDERAGFLDRVCSGEPALRAEVEELLRAAEAAEAVFQPYEQARATERVELGDPMQERPGSIIGRYKLLQLIGEGGMGVVYMAEQQEPVRRRVAFKIIKLGMDTRQVVARFEAERQALALMDHPHIAKVLDGGATDTGRPYFVMELVQGVPITGFCDQNQLSSEERLKLFIPVCHAIQHAHQKGIIHRDLKPTNVLVTLNDGVPHPMVIDFGVAKAINQKLTEKTLFTNFATMIGTPAYMSPEQAEMSKLDVDTRSDIYSLGVLLYELLTGTTPFPEERLRNAGYAEMQRIICEENPPRPSTRITRTAEPKAKSSLAPRPSSLTTDLDWIVMKCLEKDRTRRYETANGLAEDLRRHLANEPVLARPPGRLYEFKKSVQRHKVGFAATAAIVVVLFAGVLVSTWQAVRATHAKQEALAAQASEKVQRQQAQANEQKAVEAQTNERHLRRLAQIQAYAADMKAAQAALQQESRQQAVTLLDHYWPKPGEPDLRGVEWRYLWQAAKGDEVHTWKLPGMVVGASFSPDGNEVATACFDGVLRIFNVTSGKLVAKFDRGVSDDSVLISFCYAPDGSTLATASHEGIVLLDCSTWQVKRTVPLPDAERAELGSMSLSYSPDGRWLAAAESGRRIRIWNTASWESFALPARTSGRITFSPDSKLLAVARSQGGIDLWNITTKRIEETLHDPIAFPTGYNESWFLTQFSPQGDWLVGANRTGYVIMWNILSGKAVWSKQAHRSGVYGLAVSHDGKRFASGGFDQLIHIWDAASRKEMMTLKGHLNEIWSLEFSPDDRYLLTSSKDGTVMLWNAQTKPKPDYWTLDNGERPVGFTPDGRGLISISGDGKTLRHRKGPQVIKSLSCPKPLHPATTVFSPRSQSLYVLDTNGEVEVFDVNTLKAKRSFRLSVPCKTIYHISPNERWLAGRSSTVSSLCVCDVASGQSIALITGFDGRSASYDLAVFSPDNRLLAYAAENGEVKLWNIAAKRVVRTLGPHPWRVYAICFSPDGRYLASSSWAGDIRLFDVATGKETVAPLQGHGSGVHALGFSPNGATLVSGGDDASVRFWNVATGREMLIFENAYNWYARLPFLSPTGELLLYRDSTQNGRVRVTSIPTLAEIEKVHETESSVP